MYFYWDLLFDEQTNVRRFFYKIAFYGVTYWAIEVGKDS